MSFPRYPTYKESGVDWMGTVPAHWRVAPIKRVIERVESGTSVNASDLPVDSDGIGVLKTSCVYSGAFDADENKSVVAEEANRVSCPLRANTLIVSRMNTPDLVGAAGYVHSARPNLFLPDRLWQISFSDFNPRFAHYWTQTGSYRAQVEAACTGTSSSMKNLSQEQFGGFLVPVPRPSEQRALVKFLDRETAKIDALIAEQQRLMELLQEKRQAVISNAVTEGLNPDAPRKPSGVEWLGDVPRHWKIEQFRRIVRRIEQGWSPECYSRPAEANEWGVVKTGCVNYGVFNPDETKALPESLLPVEELEIRPGDLLMSRASGSPELVGSAAYVGSVRPRLMLSDKIFRLQTVPDVEPRFMAALLGSRSLRVQIERAISGADGLANNLPQSALRGFVCTIPPLTEQIAIVGWLQSETRKIDDMNASAQHGVELLQERRMALISAAVTGQFDVRSSLPEHDPTVCPANLAVAAAHLPSTALT